MLWGVLVLCVVAMLFMHQRGGRFAWLKLAAPLALILLGIACANHVEWTALVQNPAADTARYVKGTVLAVGAMVCWTWNPLKNADWLRGQWPEPLTLAGIALLVAGVIGGVRVKAV